MRQDNTSDVATPGTFTTGLDADGTAQGEILLTGPSRKHTVLIVDDEKSVLKALKRAFIDEDYRILTAGNAQDALDLLSKDQVTLVISDYRMPGLSGEEFLKKVKEKYPSVIRLMLTGVADTKTVMEAIDSGVLYKFITKPWNDDDLQLTVRLAISQHDLIQENTKLKSASEQQEQEIDRLKRCACTNCSPLGNILVSRGTILPAQLEMVEKYRSQNNTVIFKSLVELGMVEEQELIRVIQLESNADIISLDESTLTKNLSQLLSKEVCESSCLVPIRKHGDNLHIAMADILDLPRAVYVSSITGLSVSPQLATLGDIQKAIKYLYGEPDTEDNTVVEDVGLIDQAGDDVDVVLGQEEKAAEQPTAESIAPAATEMVDTIISEAFKSGASDIHIEPKTDYTLVRYRIDGLLRKGMKMSSGQHHAIISQIKTWAKMDIAERRIPQDGRITVRSGDKLVDIRVSSMPTISGEKIVCRLLDKTASVRSLDDIGVTGKALERLRNIISIPQGMIIATGPTGSGKTTSLYALMTERLSSSLNFVTIEDPVEYYLEKASQVHVRQKIGLTFASSLRCTLRQDPDVILVGEIRDIETALAAFQAAMTGHLVFTSLHTNSTIATISRLFHLGVEPYLVASAVQGIIAQRLVRKLCPECKEKREFDKDHLRVLGVSNDGFPDRLYYGRGCEKCGNSGFFGRTGLFEVFQMNDEFRQFLTANYQESQLLNMARSLGMETLLESGIKKVLDGQTTLEELLRVLGPASAYEYHCKNCGRDLDIRFSTCPYCGTRQRLICQNCHSRLEPDWVTCPYCGQK